ncbi:hypothetical protein FJ364_02980 [Candidatus Dependentiae bacterium]|nr:hypothetical protein [Candidatus Dependentiae bacterium]
MIVGLPGAGKSTFSAKLAKQLQLPLYHIDRYYWKPNWQKHQPHEWKAIHQKLIEQPAWIIEGCAIKSSFIERFAVADLVIYFKLPRWLCLWRMIKRRFSSRDLSLQDRPANCSEGLPWRLIKYMLLFDSALMRVFLPQAQSLYPNVSVVIFRSDEDANIFLRNLKS